jgi:hypothetical protein
VTVRAEAANAASAAILAALIDALLAKGVLANADVTALLTKSIGSLGPGSEPAIFVGKLMERVARG